MVCLKEILSLNWFWIQSLQQLELAIVYTYKYILNSFILNNQCSSIIELHNCGLYGHLNTGKKDHSVPFCLVKFQAFILYFCTLINGEKDTFQMVKTPSGPACPFPMSGNPFSKCVPNKDTETFGPPEVSNFSLKLTSFLRLIWKFYFQEWSHFKK